MAPNKDRLYIALYARGGAAKMPGKEDTYHWAILIGPKLETNGGRGMRYHAKGSIGADDTQWVFHEEDIPLAPTQMLLVRLMIGKVEDMARVVSIIRRTPVKQGQANWNCVIWVKELLEGLSADGKAMGTSILEWTVVRDAAMSYCKRKIDLRRFEARGSYDSSKAPTYDLLQGKETVA